ncbi:Rossmann-like domain-containing protein [Propionibacterium australiense]|uniref:Heavy-metal chelation domain n=1 Tax=Propionibacterium australiense TaxID=119981 RepID=A0A383S824_9ACTN|nr:DUF364 domain-containing protein [Propionibacterium australiense]RLP07175.1 hypothetical protein D9T14_10525 [Propionibacterium australiense]RLP07537.1 hypothetical protein D7U36_11045 [Propionibacterium australiense]SYZ34150.1 Putative heavy-metal chelation domain [Propionibacterium australiense]VEH92580.1 Domain of uncharacterised function (DUF364) [Propionibacterium australiense]
MANPWHLYEQLIAGVPAGITVTRALVNRWTVVGTDAATMGVAMTCHGGPRLPEPMIIGAELREVAALVTSWDLRLASLGTAALNAWYAQPARLEGMPGLVWDEQADCAARLVPSLASRPSAVVGHFPFTEQLTERTIVLERRPRGDDLPDPACEYELPGREFVAITGSALTNKTLPRLLELCSGARVHLVGPSTPPAIGVYPACVREFDGTVVVDPDRCFQQAGMGARRLAGSPALRRFALPTP